MGMSSGTVDQSTRRKRKGDDSFDIEGLVFPLLKPIVTTRPASRTKILCSHKEQKDDLLQDIDEVTVQNELLAKGDQDGCETPKSEEHKIPKVLECPRAPRKPKMKRKIPTLPEGFFFVPQDLVSAFLLCSMSQPRKQIHCSKRILEPAEETNTLL
uniref:Uncharacterized protein n=1 Tax=Picea sitchensis TaxID=3332 RepID=B8LLI4_PICSI|nr:unknown [Picea sitchensis]